MSFDDSAREEFSWTRIGIQGWRYCRGWDLMSCWSSPTTGKWNLECWSRSWRLSRREQPRRRASSRTGKRKWWLSIRVGRELHVPWRWFLFVEQSGMKNVSRGSRGTTIGVMYLFIDINLLCLVIVARVSFGRRLRLAVARLVVLFGAFVAGNVNDVICGAPVSVILHFCYVVVHVVAIIDVFRPCAWSHWSFLLGQRKFVQEFTLLSLFALAFRKAFKSILHRL